MHRMNTHAGATAPRPSEGVSAGPSTARRPWSVSLIAFGRPSDARTSSGYARQLMMALCDRGRLRQEFSAKCVRASDVFRGAIGLWWVDGRFKPFVRRSWLWSEAGTQTLSGRLDQAIRASGDRGPFLQVGTVVSVARDLGPHLMRTDMTVAQARRAGRLFAVSRLSRARLDSAERVQADVLAGADHVLAASQWVAESLRVDCGVPADRITVLYPSPGLVLPDTVPRPSRPGREILFVGVDWPRKGGPLLYDAFRRVHAQLPDATLRIVGCRPDVSHPAVRVEGHLDKRDPAQAERLRQCYLEAACFCMPSSFEPFGIALSEAASAGLPGVSIDTGARREAIVHGVTGALAPEPTAEALAAALIDVLGDPERTRTLGDAARALARERFSWDVAVDTVGRVLAGLASAKVAPLPLASAAGPSPCADVDLETPAVA
jgi:glycosyltransferase involved in cell wall biosynthesis